MSQLQRDLSQWFITGMFIATVLLAVLYIPNFNWKTSMPGRGFTILILALSGILLRNVLLDWKIIHITHVAGKQQYGLWEQILTWISVIGIAAAGIAIIILLVYTVKQFFT